MDVSRIHLVLFLSRATPLRAWDESGILDRETALYRRLRPRLKRISIVTSGGADEIAYRSRLGEIDVLFNRRRLPPNLYSLFSPSLHRDVLRDADVFKTNQLDGAWAAVLAARRYNKPVVVRAGYPWVRNVEGRAGRGLRTLALRFIERECLERASHIVLTTQEMKNFYRHQYQLEAGRITVIPNYVDTSVFKPDPSRARTPRQVCFVGRLSAVKNLELIIEAAAGVEGCSLLFVGDGEERPRLERLAKRLGVPLRCTGVVPHDELPEHINTSEAFVLMGRLEGHPKALIEAMACGTAVLGGDIAGIREVIDDDETGLLCPPTVEGIRDGLRRLLADRALRERLGAAAAVFAEREYNLDRVVDRELSVYQAVCTNK